MLEIARTAVKCFVEEIGDSWRLVTRPTAPGVIGDVLAKGNIYLALSGHALILLINSPLLWPSIANFLFRATFFLLHGTWYVPDERFLKLLYGMPPPSNPLAYLVSFAGSISMCLVLSTAVRLLGGAKAVSFKHLVIPTGYIALIGSPVPYLQPALFKVLFDSSSKPTIFPLIPFISQVSSSLLNYLWVGIGGIAIAAYFCWLSVKVVTLDKRFILLIGVLAIFLVGVFFTYFPRPNLFFPLALTCEIAWLEIYLIYLSCIMHLGYQLSAWKATIVSIITLAIWILMILWCGQARSLF